MADRRNGSAAQDPPVRAKIQALEGTLTSLAEAHDHNAALFRESLHWAETHLLVQQRILHDIVRGAVRTTTVDGQAQVDVVSYIVEYTVCMVFAEFVGWLRSLSSERPTLVEATEMPETIVFGGSS